MRILFVAPTYFSQDSVIGGGERYVHELSRFLGRDNELTVLSFANRSKTFSEKEVQFHISKGFSFGHFSKTNPFSLSPISLISRKTFDVVHTHQICTFVSDLACYKAFKEGIPVFGTDHGGGGAWVLNHRFKIYPKYKKVIGQSSEASEILKRDFSKQQVEMIAGGVDTEYFRPGADHRPQSDILFVGRLMEHKGIHTLIRAFVDWDQDHYNLVILGRKAEQSYYNKLQELAEPKRSRIYFKTDATDQELLEAYQNSAITVLPSEQDKDGNLPPELMGFTGMESQACGCPVIVSDAGPMNEFIKDGVTGLVFKNGDAHNLRHQLEAMTQLPGFLDGTISSDCREHVNQYSWAEVAREHQNLYEETIL